MKQKYEPSVELFDNFFKTGLIRYKSKYLPQKIQKAYVLET